ncbi:MAG: DNA-methyltransferase (cytosine-specific) [Candidatus Scalindua rubra]|uniref:DNA-methyltransferase (Cytosine-specific) n=1 Tax=Candidatus Scalindua rubra TaxID=1872076 RepID=A0A1E3XEV6_9BACT|nr:MAG: DNA-methyltransferase (cytosine-specific) [Candidatus Scalindua rubra]
MSQFLTIKQASQWATRLLEKQVTTSNISYLIQYGRIKKHNENGTILIDVTDLENYYKPHHQTKENIWKKRLGEDLNWALSFDEYKESERTKHVHRIHPYKGKFIPQLVEYFLDDHTDDFKKKVFFKKGDIILDPFCGSGTTLVQANELGMHANRILLLPNWRR